MELFVRHQYIWPIMAFNTSLIHVIACCLMAPSQYQNQSLIIINIHWKCGIYQSLNCVYHYVYLYRFLQQGRFEHKSIPIVWMGFPTELHDWLLKLTETFDLTFPVPGEALSLVPCLLPENEPPLSWKNLAENSSERENMIIYTFSYLPSGLFNRMQVLFLSVEVHLGVARFDAEQRIYASVN